MLVSGDKIVVIKDVASFLKEGDIANVLSVSEDGMVTFSFGEDFVHMGVMDSDEFEKHFKKQEIEPEEEFDAELFISERVDEIMSNATIHIQNVFDKCTVVSCQLQNGFVIVESESCVDDYDEAINVSICLDRIEEKLHELESYRLHEALYNKFDCGIGCGECCCDCCECDDEHDDCLDTDLDCDYCEDIECEFHPIHNNN